MSNRTEHVRAGAFTGLVYSAYRARGSRPEHILIEALGGALGGASGAILPDVIDPPNHPNHRHVGHGAVNVAVAIGTTASTLSNWQQSLRDQADALEAQRFNSGANGDLLSILHEISLRLLAGYLNGLAPGYISHLVLDANTAKGINLFARGC